MSKPVYTVSTAALYEHASLELATASYDEARELFDALVSEDTGQTIILAEWFDGKSTTIDIERTF